MARVRTDEHGFELQSLRAERLDHEGLRQLETVSGKGGGTNAVLVRHHDKRVATITQPRQGGEDAWQKTHLLERVDLLVRGLLDQGAVTIDEQDLHVRLRIITSF